ncbi:MAG: F0F1 ATP synthase subunit B' [PS1 clade bacterium]|jgi:F-type H+-transporting ATPase subunit b|uniref:ATP synthase subunit b n=1 Tax=PS1 clade bacterium TaxID=2175152 RepID=A0A937HJ62_9PROT|nr:F0F1 ATP synthase subunit B' [PS1 clade bacterium]
MPQLDPSTFGSQLFWLLVCFGALYLVLSFIVIPRISRTLETRAETMESDLAEAEKLRGQAEAALAAYEEALAEARSRALVLAQEMRAEVQAETDRQKAELDAQLAEQAAGADKILAAARDAAMADLKTAAAELVGDVMQAIGTDKAADGDVAKALDKVAAE